MALIRNISVGLSVSYKDFDTGINTVVGSLNRLEKSAISAQSAVGSLNLDRARGSSGGESSSKSSGTGAADNGALAALGAGSVGAIAGAIAPLSQFGAQINAQLNAVGGTITTLARRIDSAIKFPQTKAALDDLQNSLQKQVKAASETATESLTKFQRVVLALGPAANTSINGLRNLNSAQVLLNRFSGRGDVARKSLQQLGAVKFDKSIQGATQLKSTLGTVPPVANRASTAVKGLGLQIGLALGVVGLAYKATTALVGFFKGGISGAIDLGESLNKTKEVFGSSTGEIVGLADSMSKSFGFAKGPLLDAASNIGLIGQGAGQSAKQSSAMASSMTRLAADASSFYNVPIDSALEKIRAGLVGEAEPLRAFGVLLSEDAVKQEGLRLGLIRTGQQLDDQGKVAARASLITKGLSKASGDLARTQSDTKNAAKNLGGTITNLSTNIGTALLPAVQAGIGVLGELATAAVAAFEENRGMFEGWVTSIKSGIEVVGGVIRNFGDYWEIFKLSALQQLGNVLAYIETIPGDLGIIADYVAGNWREWISDGVQSVGLLFQNLGTNIGNLAYQVNEFLSGRGFNFEWTGLLEGFKRASAELPELLKPNLISMETEMGAVFDRIARNEQQRAKGFVGPPKPGIGGLDLGGGSKTKGEGSEYHGTAAVELGSREAASALARHRNQSTDDKPAKEAVEIQKKMLLELQMARKETGKKDTKPQLGLYHF